MYDSLAWAPEIAAFSFNCRLFSGLDIRPSSRDGASDLSKTQITIETQDVHKSTLAE